MPGLRFLAPASAVAIAIPAEPAPPEIDVSLQLTGLSAAEAGQVRINGTARVDFDAATNPHGPHRQMTMSVPIAGQGLSVHLRFPQIRGGILTIEVTAVTSRGPVSGRLTGVRVIGTNPTARQIAAAIPQDMARYTETLVRIAQHESHGGNQFETGTSAHAHAGRQRIAGFPLWSGDNLGGVGLFQVTRPRPTDDEVWNWKSNVAAGARIFAEKLQAARHYARRLERSHAFRLLVDRMNAARTARGLRPLDVSVPALSADQIERDAIRGFNGYAGRDGFGHELHEYRPARDAFGNLVLDMGPGELAAHIRWEQVPAGDRPAGVGDPNYVANVLRQAGLAAIAPPAGTVTPPPAPTPPPLQLQPLP